MPTGRRSGAVDAANTDAQFKERIKEQLREEVAKELGIDAIYEGYLGQLTNSECGKFGALLQKRMNQVLKSRHMPKN